MNVSSLTSIPERQSHLFKIMTSQKFLQMQGLSNEVPFFIFPYRPQEQTEIVKMTKSLSRKLAEKGIRVREANLYDLAIGLIKEAGIFEAIIQNENSFSKKELFEDLQGVLDPERYIAPKIAEIINKYPVDILFITGVGEVYPYIRSHNILNNLQRFATEHPTVLWFPGEYTYSPESGSALRLFGELSDNRYYRAFNILEYKI